jgi:hypothetical protein
MIDNRTGVPLITEILDVLDRHGYTPSDTAHTARTILLISDLAHIYESSQDHSCPCTSGSSATAPPQPTPGAGPSTTSPPGG